MKLTSLLKLLSLSAIATGAAFSAGISSASAFSLVPQVEGEINTGLGTAISGSYLSTPDFTVTSLVDSSTGTKSRLFVDKAGTSNTYGGIQFLSTDIGTSDALNSYWFRPVAMQADGVTPLIENGQLEVGTFQFSFASPVEKLVMRWFDTEYQGGTSYSVNGGSSVVVNAGSNGNIYEQTFTNVSSLVLNLGERRGATGDGVDFQMSSAAVPEPTTMAGLALAGAGMSYIRRRRRQA